MKIRTKVNKEFLSLFYHEIKDYILEKSSTKLNLFILKIENNRFQYDQLITELTDCIITYALSKQELEEYKQSEGGKKYFKAVKRLRDYKTNDGELGEVLLYCLLEAHLNAPKIFTKLKLKTSSQDYVKGSDGIHLLKIKKNNYQLVFGESKMDEDLTRSLSEGFKSIYEFVTRKKNNIYDETRLLSSYLGEEVLDKQSLEFLRKLIIPSKNDENFIKDNAFGVFAAYDLKITEIEMKLPNEEFRTLIRNKIKTEVNDKIAHIESKINHYELFGYNFYIYIIPFTELSTQRKKIIENLTVL